MSKIFHFSNRNTTFKQELIAGLSTFATMAYILVVNSSILNDAGMNFGSVVIATIIVIAFSSFFMGLLANLPIVIGPGMGVSAYITYTLVLGKGRSWEECLGAVLIVGVILVLLTLFKIRQKVITEIPLSLRHGITSGIGLFLIFVGLKNVEIIKQDGIEWISFGNLWTVQSLFTLIGVAVIIGLEALKVRSAYIIVIILSWVFGIGYGLTPFEGVVSMPPSINPTLLKFDISHFFQWDFIAILFSIFLVTLLDSSAALMTLLKMGGLYGKGKDVSHNIFRSLIPDGIGSVLSACVGTTSLAIHMESAAGIKAGGKTGFVSIVVAIGFLTCLFFYPIIVNIPKFASASVLIVIGAMMFWEIKHILWKDMTEWIPSLIMIFSMPFTMSIYNGFALGFIFYSILKLLTGRIRKVHFLVWMMSLLFLVHRVIECFL